MEQIERNPNLEYKDKVWGQLLSMNCGEEFSLKEKVAPERKSLFIAHVKEFIHFDGDNKKSYIEFANDYTKLRKVLIDDGHVTFQRDAAAPVKEKAISDKAVKELEDYFASTMLPTAIQLTPHENITNVKKFVASHIATIQENRGVTFLPYLERLQKLKVVCSGQGRIIFKREKNEPMG